MISEEMNSRFARDPVILTAVSELASVGYVTHPDADTIELTSRGFDALQSGGGSQGSKGPVTAADRHNENSGAKS